MKQQQLLKSFWSFLCDHLKPEEVRERKRTAKKRGRVLLEVLIFFSFFLSMQTKAVTRHKSKLAPGRSLTRLLSLTCSRVRLSALKRKTLNLKKTRVGEVGEVSAPFVSGEHK